MKYRFKIDCPMGKKGVEAPMDSYGHVSHWIGLNTCPPGLYPDLFEPIPEEDPLTKVRNWLEHIWKTRTYEDLEDLSKQLLAAGLRPEDLSK